MRFMATLWHITAVITMLLPCLTVSFFVKSNPLNQLTYFTEHFPPYNFIDEDNQLRGIAVDLLTEMLKIAGSNVSPSQFESMPWSLAYRKALLGPNILLFSTALTEERRNQFKWIGPITTTKNVFIRFKQPGSQPFSENSIEQYRYVFVRDDISEVEFKQRYTVPNAQLSFRDTVKEAIELLEKGQAEIFIYEFRATEYALKYLGLDIKRYEVVHHLNSNDLYFALSKDVSDSTARLLEDAFFQIPETFKLDIINNY